MRAERTTWQHRGMGTDFKFILRSYEGDVAGFVEDTRWQLDEMDRAWSRFRGDSELSVLNKTKRVARPSPLFKLAMFEAANAFRITRGAFDPRVKSALTSLGYDVSFEKIGTGNEVGGRQQPTFAEGLPRAEKFSPIYDLQADTLDAGNYEIDFGGIGKGLALRLLSAHLRQNHAGSHLIDAGGDIVTYLQPQDNLPWYVDIEHPLPALRLPILLRLGTRAVATSSTKIRTWKQDGITKHHLIDPITMDSAASDLCAVTVIDSDPARAEIYTKWIFLQGHQRGLQLATSRKIAAFMVDTDGQISYTATLGRFMEVQGNGATVTQKVNHVQQSPQFWPISIST